MRSYPLPAASGNLGGETALAGSSVMLRGWTIVESATTAAAAYVTLRDGGVSTGNIVAAIKVAASGSTNLSHNEAIRLDGPLYVKYESGTVTGAIYLD